ncbi:MAG: 50S ribosomal protein L33 [Thermodesulfovibrio sp.]|uniref:50S ribosomal protein L33 n=1 Tax=unclassified Thermodesulfovibrio TaxID=2645936 RepID=UPI00083A349E|nr:MULTISPECIES: 50S ribosomal protein L33 [unclassified Thermodesulfovibrio]MDI1471224.1 50S ribosomal protein L33 [Thermodesulfovibrio sp. 1176]MDI6714771.1 50S ribosomal protein L33 [Thermodesulfovibrio sp.]ODA43983.1 LSU ribosomal protein L33p [Thermodesulfovibrio sp. N1]
MRDIILLQCTDCKSKNYSTTKNKKTTPDKLQLRKYCKFCKKHTVHKETKA